MCDPFSHVRTQFTGVMGSLSQQLIDIYDGRVLQRSHSQGWKQDAILPPGGGRPGGICQDSVHGTLSTRSWHTARGGSRFIGTRAAQLVVGVERKRERERERGYWVLKTGYGGKYKYLSGPHMTTMTLDIKTQYRLFTFVYCSASFHWRTLYAQSGLHSNIFYAFSVPPPSSQILVLIQIHGDLKMLRKVKAYLLRFLMTVSIWSGPGKLSWWEAGSEWRVPGVGCSQGRSIGAARAERERESHFSGERTMVPATWWSEWQYVIIMCGNKVTLFDAIKIQHLTSQCLKNYTNKCDWVMICSCQGM